MNERIALVAGGTGLVGASLIAELLGRPGWSKVVAVGRRPPERSDPRLENLRVDFGALGESAPLPAADAAFCCLGTTIKKAGSEAAFRAVDLDAVVRFARAARAGGTGRFFIVTALGADPRSRMFYSRVKGEAEEALKGIGFASLGFARPSLLLGDRAESRPGERVAILVARALRPALRPFAFRPIEARTVARALIALAENPPEGIRAYDNPELFALGA